MRKVCFFLPKMAGINPLKSLLICRCHFFFSFSYLSSNSPFILANLSPFAVPTVVFPRIHLLCLWVCQAGYDLGHLHQRGTTGS